MKTWILAFVLTLTCPDPPMPYTMGTVGDSINVGIFVPSVTFLNERMKWHGWSVSAFAVSGTLISDSKIQYETGIQGKGFSTVCTNSGINNLYTGETAAAAWAEQLVVLNEMYADGMRIVVVNLSPCNGASGCPVATIPTYNASEAAWVSTHSDRAVLVDAYTLMGNGTSLKAMCVQTDNLHPSAECTQIRAFAIADAAMVQ